MIVLQSLHKYQPRLHIVEVTDGEPEAACAAANTHIFTFQETQFIAVTAYQNAEVSRAAAGGAAVSRGPGRRAWDVRDSDGRVRSVDHAAENR